MNKFILIFISFIIFSCVKQPKETDLTLEMKRFYGKKVSFTDNLIYSQKKDSLQLSNLLIKPYKLIVYVDSAACTPCSLEKMTLWKKYNKELIKLNVTLIFMICHSNIHKINDILHELQIINPVFLDVNGVFAKINQLPKNPELRTFLLNPDNQIIFIGAPIQNEKSWILFEKIMNKLIANNNQLPGLSKKTD